MSLDPQMSEDQTSIRAVLDCPRGGRIVTMGFPGLAIGLDGTAYVDPESMRATLDDPRLSGCARLIALTEAEELPADALSALAQMAAERGFAFDHRPIADYAAPSADFEVRWRQEGEALQALLDEGATIGVTCHYGAGRSGTIAARLLIDRGMTAEAAIAHVRAGFSESIESDAQHAWLTA